MLPRFSRAPPEFFPLLQSGRPFFWPSRSPRSGVFSGEVVTFLPEYALLPHQQLPVFSGKASHQKSTPFGLYLPSLSTPIVLLYCLLSNDVEMPATLQPGTG